MNMNIKRVIANDLKVGDKLPPHYFGMSWECSDVEIKSINRRGDGESNIALSGTWTWNGKSYTGKTELSLVDGEPVTG